MNLWDECTAVGFYELSLSILVVRAENQFFVDNLLVQIHHIVYMS